MLIYYNEVSLYIKHMIQETDVADSMNTRWHAANIKLIKSMVKSIFYSQGLQVCIIDKQK